MAEHKGRDVGVPDVDGVTALTDAPGGIGSAPAHEPKPETLATITFFFLSIAKYAATASPNPPQISLAPIKKLRAQFNPLADGLVYLVVFIGGFVGTAARYGLSALWPAHDTGFPVATFVANMAACLLFSLLTETMASAWLRRRVRQLTSRGLGLGLCGGLSTMSTVMLEGLRDILGHDPWMAVSYMLASMVGGVLCCVAGVCLAHVFTASRAAQSMRRMSLGSSPAHGVHAVKMNQDAAAVGADSGDSVGADVADGTANGMPASFEPTPITAEIPMVPDPVTGEVH